MNINEYFGTALKAEDLPPGRKATVVIDGVSIQKFDDGDKPLVHFQGKQKGLLLNVTNKNSIVDLYGPETDQWIGQPLVLFQGQTQFQGKSVACVRIDEAAVRHMLAPPAPQQPAVPPQYQAPPAPQQPVAPPASPPQERQPGDDGPPAHEDDDIPF